jgi:hypothetical protein
MGAWNGGDVAVEEEEDEEEGEGAGAGTALGVRSSSSRLPATGASIVRKIASGGGFESCRSERREIVEARREEIYSWKKYGCEGVEAARMEERGNEEFMEIWRQL